MNPFCFFSVTTTRVSIVSVTVTRVEDPRERFRMHGDDSPPHPPTYTVVVRRTWPKRKARRLQLNLTNPDGNSYRIAAGIVAEQVRKDNLKCNSPRGDSRYFDCGVCAVCREKYGNPDPLPFAVLADAVEDENQNPHPKLAWACTQLRLVGGVKTVGA